MQDVLKLKRNPGAKRLNWAELGDRYEERRPTRCNN